MKQSRLRISKILLTGATLLALVSVSPAQASSTTSSPTSKKTVSKKSHRRHRPRGQQKVDSQRVQAIQDALVREHYLPKATGKWDATTQQALQKYQADNGWQSKVVPDSRALIKLGLGPDHDHLLNPESAMTSLPGPKQNSSDPPADPKK